MRTRPFDNRAIDEKGEERSAGIEHHVHKRTTASGNEGLQEFID